MQATVNMKQQCLLFIAAHFDFDVFACHIPGSLDVATDTLSLNVLPLFLANVDPYNQLFLVKS